MNPIKNWLPFLIALVPQILFENYNYVLVLTIVIGFLAGWFVTDRKIFTKMFLIQLVFFSALFYSTTKNIAYLNQVIENLGMPSFLIDIIFILFNTLNIAILFLFGYRLQKLIFKKFSSEI